MMMLLETGEDLVHCLAFTSAVPDKYRIIDRPGLQAILTCRFTETWRGVGNYGVDVDFRRYRVNFVRLENWRLIGLPRGRLRLAELVKLLILPHSNFPVHADRSTNT